MIIQEHINNLIENKRQEIAGINEVTNNKYKYKDQFINLLKSTDNKYKFYVKNDPENADLDTMLNFYDKEIKTKYKNSKEGELHEIVDEDKGSYKFYTSIKVSFPDRICYLRLEFKESRVVLSYYKEKVLN